MGGCRWGVLGVTFPEVADAAWGGIASATILDCQQRRLSTNREADDEMNFAKLHHRPCPTLGVLA